MAEEAEAVAVGELEAEVVVEAVAVEAGLPKG